MLATFVKASINTWQKRLTKVEVEKIIDQTSDNYNKLLKIINEK